MRPLRIRAEGFSTYRSPVDVTFEDVDFFSLSGATGSGKSSLVDAMVFALYGVVPRLGKKSAGSEISAGADWARVQFDFELDDEQYTVVRRVKRTASGSSTDEVRLQKGESVIADAKAKAVLEAVEGRLNLKFEDFVKTVVLPQGEFAEFLSSDKAERQALLRKLLGFDIYRDVRSLAGDREKSARARADVAQIQLDELDVPDEEKAKEATQRVRTLEDLAASVVRKTRDLQARQVDHDVMSKELAQLESALESLRDLKAPDRLEEFDRLAGEAESAVEQAVKAREGTIVATEQAEESLAALPTIETLSGFQKARSTVESLQHEISTLGLEDARKSAEAAAGETEAAKKVVEGLMEQLDEARKTHAAHDLALNLVEGDSCPVCAQTVEMVPSLQAPPVRDTLDGDLKKARLDLDAITRAESESKAALAAAEATVAAKETQIADLTQTLQDAPDPGEIEKLLERHAELSAELENARKAGRSAEQAEKTARAEYEKVTNSIQSVGIELMAARQTVASLEPPLPASDDPIVQWKELLLWRDEMKLVLRERLDTSTAKVEASAKTLAGLADELTDEVRAAGIETSGELHAAVTKQVDESRAVVLRHETVAAEARRLDEIIGAANAEANVAGALFNHLKANNFEQWLMAGAMEDLVIGANDLLGQLSDGGYSLRSDETGGFSIIDHRNANEERQVSTLSGGETFLVSLALALSLAETLAVAGGSSLEAIILDEGFGTLDEETLDTVASVLEELAGEGLMVGVITHVKELAARAPVRYEVTKTPAGSVVEKVVA